ncbi:hypothetical protein LSH36_535g03041, partial [Paralvinella palmiformis]
RDVISCSVLRFCHFFWTSFLLPCLWRFCLSRLFITSGRFIFISVSFRSSTLARVWTRRHFSRLASAFTLSATRMRSRTMLLTSSSMLWRPRGG